MKYLLIIAIALVVVWLWRSGRPSLPRSTPAGRGRGKPAADKQAIEMVACGVCHVHLPRSDALPGPNGFYCSEAHRRAAGA